MKIENKCNKCFKGHNQTISLECNFCKDYGFNESILCELARASQKGNELFECEAFRPNLTFVGTKDEKEEIPQEELNRPKKEIPDRTKWFRAYALQQWEFDPGLIFCELNYHLCIITPTREKLFSNTGNHFDKFSEIFNSIGDFFNAKINLLYMSVDHLHIHIDSPPDYPADEIVNKIITNSEAEILKAFPEYQKNIENIFIRNYFIETVG
ncbi:MAG: transposase [Candidatus Scalindua rubra]|nr:transposase [Candidatus Scalindua rubra]